jgi:hypothetical protein
MFLLKCLRALFFVAANLALSYFSLLTAMTLMSPRHFAMSWFEMLLILVVCFGLCCWVAFARMLYKKYKSAVQGWSVFFWAVIHFTAYHLLMWGQEIEVFLDLRLWEKAPLLYWSTATFVALLEYAVARALVRKFCTIVISQGATMQS